MTCQVQPTLHQSIPIKCQTIQKIKIVPKLGMTITQYVWCWGIILSIYATGATCEFLGVSGYYIYLYTGSVSLAAIALLLKFAGKSRLVFALSFFELLAILLQLAACYANLTQKVNWFYENYRDILVALYNLEVLLLTIVGTYGFILLAGLYCWRLFTSGDNSSHKSYIYPILHERRQKRR